MVVTRRQRHQKTGDVTSSSEAAAAASTSMAQLEPRKRKTSARSKAKAQRNPDGAGEDIPSSDAPQPSSDTGHDGTAYLDDDEPSTTHDRTTDQTGRQSPVLLELSSDPPEPLQSHADASQLSDEGEDVVVVAQSGEPDHPQTGARQPVSELEHIQDMARQPGDADQADSTTLGLHECFPAAEQSDTDATATAQEEATELPGIGPSEPRASSAGPPDSEAEEGAHSRQAVQEQADSSAPLIRLDSSPPKSIAMPALIASGSQQTEMALLSQRNAALNARIDRKEAEIRASRIQLRKFATLLASTFMGDNAASDPYGKAARRTSLFGRLSIGYGADASRLDDGDASIADFTLNPLLHDPDQSLDQDLRDDIDNLGALWRETYQRWDFEKVEGLVERERLRLDLASAQQERAQGGLNTDLSPSHRPEDDAELTAELQAVREQAASSAEKYEAELRAQRTEVETLKKALQSSDDQVFDAQERLAQAQKEIEEGKKENERLLDEEREASASILQAISKELEQLQTKKSQLEQALHQARADLADAEKVKADAERVKDNEEQLQVLHAELMAAEEQLKELGDEKVELEQRFANERTKLAEDLDSSKAEAVQLRSRLVTIESDLTTAQRQIEDLESNHQQSIAKLEQELRDARASGEQVEHLRQQVVKLEQELDEARTSSAGNSALRDELAAVKHQLADANDQAAKLTELETKLEGVDKLKKTAVDLQASLDTQRELVQKLTFERDEQGRSMTEERAAAAQNMLEATIEMSKLQSRVGELDKALQEAQSDALAVEEVRKELSRVQAETTEAARRQEAQMQEEVKRARDLEEELQRKEVEMNRLRTRVVSSEGMTNQAKEENDSLLEQVRGMQTERQVLFDKIVAMETELAQSSKSSAASKETLDNLHGRIYALEDQIKAQKRQAQDAEELRLQVAQLEDELARKVEEIEENDTKMLTVMKERKRLEARCKKLEAKVAQATISSTSSSETLRLATPTPPPAVVPREVARAPAAEPIVALAPVPAAMAVHRSPLITSNSANTPLARQVSIKAAKVASAESMQPKYMVLGGSEQPIQSSTREPKPPSPWSFAVALSDKPVAHARTSPGDGMLKSSRPFAHHETAQRKPSSSATAPRPESRKRSSPDDEAEMGAREPGSSSSGPRSVSSSMQPLTRPIYVPSPHKGSGFVPQRRSKTDLGASYRDAAPAGSTTASATSTTAGLGAGSSTQHSTVARQPSQPTLSAAERLAGRLAGNDRPAPSRVRVGSAGVGAGGPQTSKLSSHLAEMRGRRGPTASADL
ncbi:hypothetical protein V8E36_000352 [Tilletia maclaganii]